MISFLRSHPLTSYFVLAFVFAWAVWLPMIFWQLPPVLMWLAGIAPIGSGILVTWLADGRDGLRALGQRLTLKGLTLRWILIASLLPLGLRLVSLTFDSAVSVSILPLFGLAFLKGLAYTPMALFEEVGWRGFALPRLVQKYSPLASALVLGIIWAAWHIPLLIGNSFLYADMNPYWWVVDILFVSLFLTWMFTKTQGNLWLPCLFHGMANMTASTLPLPAGSITNSVISLVVIALFIVWIGVGKVTQIVRRKSKELENGKIISN